MLAVAVIALVIGGSRRTDPTLGAALAAMLEDDPDEERLARTLALLREPAPSAPGYIALLRELVEDESDAVRSIAAHHVGELGLDELSGVLARLRDRAASPAEAEVIENALARLRERSEARHG